MTDLVAYLMLMVMNTNDHNNAKFTLEQPWLIVVVCVLQVILIELAVYGGNWVFFKIYDPEKCLIITSSQRSLNEISRSIKKYKLQFKICRNIDYRNESLNDIIPKYDTIFVYDVPIKERTQIVEFCYQNMKNVYINPEMADVVEVNAHHVMLDDVSLLEFSSVGLTAEQKFFKRLFDIVLSVIALIATSPLVLIAAIAIKIDDGGKIVFKQNRATRGGKIFAVYKLRTMKENVDNYLSVVGDDRITKVGSVLRRFRIDEIPQFLNVIKGDMSIVGPRPEMLANIFNYTNALPEFEYRLRVKAGITGYAQIAGKYNTLPKDKLILDLMYIEEYSLWLDIKLIFQTLIVIFKKDSTEAFDRETEEKMEHYAEEFF
jgi:lipopolysaccharide/colanic/teichoic acid biosynthesis glycosyltransferase